MTHLGQARTKQVALAFKGGYSPRPRSRTRMQIRTPVVCASTAASTLVALSACPRLGHYVVQRIHVFLNVVLLEKFICVVLVNKDERGPIRWMCD